MAEYSFETYDVFTQRRFGGNPLAVVFDADGLSSNQMQTIAREFNLSETTFVLQPLDQANTANVRIFTPAFEMPFAGHPTIGTAIALARRMAGRTPTQNLVLEELAGLVAVTITSLDTEAPFAQFISPVLPEVPYPVSNDELAASAVSLDPGDIGFGNHTAGFVKAGNDWLFVPVNSQDALARAHVNASDWQPAKEGREIVGAFVYAHGGEAVDTAYRGRMFAPDAGIIEDPATGSAVAALPGQILAHDGLPSGTHKWTIEQGYEMGRPSLLYLEADVAGDRLAEIRLGGAALPVSSGILQV